MISDSEASTILGMQTTWFAVALVFLILSVGCLVTASVLCFFRKHVLTPRHPHNAHSAQSHPPVSFPCESQKTPLTCTRSIARVVVVAVAAVGEPGEYRSLLRFTSRIVASKHGQNFFPVYHELCVQPSFSLFLPLSFARTKITSFRAQFYTATMMKMSFPRLANCPCFEGDFARKYLSEG